MKQKKKEGPANLRFRIDLERKTKFLETAKKMKITQTELMKRLIDSL